MADKPRSRRRKRRRSRKPSNSKQKREKQIPSRPKRIKPPLPEVAENKVILLDQEDFYSIYLDLVFFNLSRPGPISVQNGVEYKQLKERLASGKYKDNMYLLDETFGWGVLKIEELVALIRKGDEKAFIVGMTAMTKEDIRNPELFDAVSVKSRNVREDNITLLLADKFGVDFVESNTEKEYNGVTYMNQLLEEGDNFPQKIYRDPGNGQEGTLL